jgi:hypothetical protein
MFSMAAASLFLLFLPLLPKQILVTNLMTDFPDDHCHGSGGPFFQCPFGGERQEPLLPEKVSGGLKNPKGKAYLFGNKVESVK